ncbi:MAG: hypothetical protein Fur007_15380 [Rhodoferax sp.]
MTVRKRSRWIQEGRDLLEVVLLPGLAAVLPWGLCFKLYQRMARWNWLYREQVDSAHQRAAAMGWGGKDTAHWRWVRRLTILVDHADHYLGLTRSDRWMQCHVTVQGAWPEDAQALLLTTFHWGNGYWGLRHARSAGLRPHALVASLETPTYLGRWVLTRYARARNANVARTLGASVFDTKKQLKNLVQAVRCREPLLAVVDAPVEMGQNAVTIRLLGCSARFAGGMVRLIEAHHLSTVVYWTGLNTRTGQRFLTILPAIKDHQGDALVASLYAPLQRLIQENAPAWHFWGEAPRIFTTVCAQPPTAPEPGPPVRSAA